MDANMILAEYLFPRYLKHISPSWGRWICPVISGRYKKCVRCLTETGRMEEAAMQLKDQKHREDFNLNYGFRGRKHRHLGCFTRDYVFFAGRGIVVPYDQIRRLSVERFDVEGGDFYCLELSTAYLDQIYALELHSMYKREIKDICSRLQQRLPE